MLHPELTANGISSEMTAVVDVDRRYDATFKILPRFEWLRPGKTLKFYVYKDETPDVPVGSEVIFIGGKSYKFMDEKSSCLYLALMNCHGEQLISTRRNFSGSKV